MHISGRLCSSALGVSSCNVDFGINAVKQEVCLYRLTQNIKNGLIDLLQNGIFHSKTSLKNTDESRFLGLFQKENACLINE